jgi:hypothetical protein
MTASALKNDGPVELVAPPGPMIRMALQVMFGPITRQIYVSRVIIASDQPGHRSEAPARYPVPRHAGLRGRRRAGRWKLPESIQSGQRCPHSAPGLQSGHPPGTVEAGRPLVDRRPGWEPKKSHRRSSGSPAKGTKYAGGKPPPPHQGLQRRPEGANPSPGPD